MDDQEENESILDPKHLQLQGVFENQVKTIFETMRMSRKEVINLERVYKDIQDTFDKLWEGCLIKPFGSVVTGLAVVMWTALLIRVATKILFNVSKSLFTFSAIPQRHSESYLE